MATWHQNLNNIDINHPTKWSVETNQLHKMRSVMRFDTLEQCQTYMQNLEKNNIEEWKSSRIVPPIL